MAEETKLDISHSRIDTLFDENRDDEFEIGDSVNSIVQDILNTYNDTLLNKYS